MQNTVQKLEGSPYVGPRSFEWKDRDLFFGRDYETMQIISLVLSSPLTLIYSQSGVGKTSLINTQIIFELEEHYEFKSFPSARVRSLLSSDKIPEEIDNIYMFNALQSLKPDADPESLKKMTLADFLKQQVANRKKEDEKLPRIIVFDQLEELFSLYPENWYQQQQDFFEQIAKALNEDTMLRIILIIREEYLAPLSSFSELLPGKLRARFRLEKLGKEAALSAVIGPLKGIGHVIFAPGVAEKLVEDLLTMKVENVFGNIVDMKGEYVEPVYLQVVCQRLWMKVISEGITEITQEHLKGFGNVNEALEEFYLDTIAYAARQTGTNMDRIRNWFEENLITSSGTRGIVHRESKTTGGLPNNVVDVLQQKYLIRQEWRSGSRWYELTHDMLIGPIQDSNNYWQQYKQKKKIKKITVSAIAASVVTVIVVVVYFTFLPTSPTSPTSQETLIINQLLVSSGASPYALAVNPTTNMIYVTNLQNDTISVIDGKTNSVIAKVPVLMAISPYALAVNPTTNMIYVAIYDAETISVIDGKTNNILDRVSVHHGNEALPYALAVNPTTNIIYVTNENDSAISVIDGNTNEVTTTVPGGTNSYPSGSAIAVNPITNLIYVTNDAASTFSVIDGKTNKVTTTLPLSGYGPNGLAVNPTTNMIYLTNNDAATISVIDGKTNRQIIDVPVGGGPSFVAVNPTTNIIYVVNEYDDTISVIDGKTNKLIATIPVGKEASAVAVNPTTNMSYVTNTGDNTVSILSNTTHVTNELDNTTSDKKQTSFSFQTET